MTPEPKSRVIIFLKDLFDFVIFSDPNVDVMIAYAGGDGLRHETQHPIPEWLMNDATVVVEREGGEPPTESDALYWVNREQVRQANALIDAALLRAEST